MAFIRINVVAPGPTRTEKIVSRLDPVMQASVAEQQPIVRMVTPAAAFLWICSPRVSGTTGITVPVDIGCTAR